MTTDVRLKWLLHEVDERAHEQAPELPLLSVSISSGVRPRSETTGGTRAASEDLSNYKICQSGELVINRMRAFQGALGVASESGLVSPDYSVLRISPSIEPRWLNYLLTSDAVVAEMASLVRGIGGTDAGNVRTPRLNVTDLHSIRIDLEPLEVQRAIADFLDRETARIDTFIEEQQRLIDMLQERRQAVIDLAFDAIPKNSRIARGCVDIVDCPHTTPTVDADGHFEAVRTASVRAGRFRPGHGLRVSEGTWRERNSNGSPSPGDVLFAREGGSAGEAAMVPSADICLGQRMVLLRIDHKVCVGEFLLWQIYSRQIQDRFRLATSGAAAGNIRLPVLRRTPIWLPSVETQREVAAVLNEKITRIDTLTAETERFIELSRERRTALITAAVTGQIEVRAEVA